MKTVEDREELLDKKINMAKTIVQEEIVREKTRNNIIVYSLETRKAKNEQEQKTEEGDITLHFVNKIL